MCWLIAQSWQVASVTPIAPVQEKLSTMAEQATKKKEDSDDEAEGEQAKLSKTKLRRMRRINIAGMYRQIRSVCKLYVHLSYWCIYVISVRILQAYVCNDLFM